MPEPSLAVLVDFENVARPGAKSRGDFDIQLVLSRLAEKGRVLVKRSYADWSRYRDARHDLQNAGLELIELPSAREGAKNRADIKLAVDAMELAYSREHLDYFVIVSGDSDFTPLVGKLRELNKRVIGIAHKESASDLLIANCDEFIFYETIAKAGGQSGRGRGSRDLDPMDLVRETLEALQREGTEWPLASVVKDSMRRKFPAFDESDHGHGTFSKFLEAMRDHGIVRLETDPRSGTYRVELAESRQPGRRREAAATTTATAPTAAPGEERTPAGENGETGRRRRRRRRGGGGEGGPEGAGSDTAEITEVAEVEEGMEVFEIRVTPTPDKDLGTLPPLDQPISYEDMLMLSPEIAAELPPVPETDVAAQHGPPAREARRRRRKGTREEEASLGTLSIEADEAEAALEPDMAVSAPEAEQEPPVTAGRGRVRRRGATAVAAPEEAPAEEETAPKRRVRTKAAAADTVGAVPEAPDEEEAKPKRRVRTKAAVTEEPATDAMAESPAEEEAKPKRRVRSKAAAAGTADAVSEAPVEEEAKPKRRVRTKAAVTEETAAETPAETAGAEAPAEEEATSARRRVRRRSSATPNAPAPSDDDGGIGPGKSPY